GLAWLLSSMLPAASKADNCVILRRRILLLGLLVLDFRIGRTASRLSASLNAQPRVTSLTQLIRAFLLPRCGYSFLSRFS
ncbi:MAG: hypothetical protein MJ109_05080, partial [Kiritimatiellae bacterium]|nr:hypothetical protein [Kiritimatiellia bacterium]